MIGLQMNHDSDKYSDCINVECRCAEEIASHHPYLMEVVLNGTWMVAELIGICIVLVLIGVTVLI